MSTENTPAVVQEDIDLDAFAADFFGQKTSTDSVQEEEANPSDEETDETDSNDASDETDDTHPEDDDTLETEDDADEAPKPKKNRFQERIDELTAKAREAERRSNDLEAKLQEAITKLDKASPKDTPAASKPVAESTGPKPDDKNENGEDKYPLGEFDPAYIRDLTRHEIEAQTKAVKEREEQEKQAASLKQAELELVNSWTQKLDSAVERYPDLKDKNTLLEDTFSSIEPNYGKYLAATIMSMEYGPDVLYYLGNNLDEAKNIVASGATKATIALGRLEAKFANAQEEKQKAVPRVSKAPTPPPTNKGSAAAIAEIADDTDDLDAFEKKFYAKKKKA